MKSIRVIPKLDIKGPNLVKGIHLEGLRVLGKPEDFAYQYYVDGADELIYMDVVASLYGRNSLLDIVSRTAEKIFIPLTVGGGIRSIEDIRSALYAGADKVAINTAAIKTPELIIQGARRFGSQCIVVSIEAKCKENGSYEAYTDNGRERTGIDVFQWAVQVQQLGAGEIMVTAIDKEGTGKGYDIELVKKISESVSIPVIACGGAGSMESFVDVIDSGCADAVSAASVFHYKRLQDIIAEDKYKDEGNIEFLKNYAKDGIRRLKVCSIRELKEYLINKGVEVRLLKDSECDKVCK